MAAQAPGKTIRYSVQVDVTPARRKLRRLLSLAREVNAELASLDDQLAGLETRREELAQLGIRLEVEHV